MKFKVHRGSKEKQRANVKHSKFEASDNVSSSKPFAEFVKKKKNVLQSSQMNGAFIKKSKGTSINVNSSEALGQESDVKPEIEMDTTLHQKKQKKLKRLKLYSEGKMQKGPVKKMKNLSIQQVLNSENVKFHPSKTHKKSNKGNRRLFDTDVADAAADKRASNDLPGESHGWLMHDEISEKQTKAIRNQESKLNDSDVNKVKMKEQTKYDKGIIKNLQTEVNVQNEQIQGNKMKPKKMKQKKGFKETAGKRIFMNSIQESGVNICEESQQHEKLKASENADHISNGPNKTKKRKHSFHKGPHVELSDANESLNENDNPVKCGKDMLMQIKKKHRTNSHSLCILPNKHMISGETEEGVLKQKIEFLPQPGMPRGNNIVSEARNKGAKLKILASNITMSQVLTSTDNQVKYQNKKQKRRKQPFSEKSCDNSDRRESSSGPSDNNKNFRLDYGSNESVKQEKKKRKKNLKTSFEDVMQDSSSDIIRNKIKVKKLCTQNKIGQTTSVVGDDGEESKNDSSNFISLAKKKLRGFEGREDTPERLGRTVFVGNLPLSADKRMLQVLFRNFGQIESMRFRSAVPTKSSIPKKVALIRKEFHSESNSIHAYVVFKKLEDAKKALTLNRTVTQGHHIRVDLFKNNDVYDNKRSIFVGNLPFNITDESLWAVFGECGSIEAVRLVRDPETGIGKGFGFVLFENRDSVKSALLLNETEVNGRNIRVKIVEDGKKLKERTPEGEQRIGLKVEKKNIWKSGWRSAGQKKTKKKLIKKKKDMQNKKRIAAILTSK